MFSIILLWIIGILIAKLYLSDIPEITKEEKVCAHEFINQHFDNPLQRIAIVKIAIDEKQGDVFKMGVYSLFGLRCGEVHLVCDTWAKTVGKENSSAGWCV